MKKCVTVTHFPMKIMCTYLYITKFFFGPRKTADKWNRGYWIRRYMGPPLVSLLYNTWYVQSTMILLSTISKLFFLMLWCYLLLIKMQTINNINNTLNCWIKRDQLDVTYFIISLFHAQHVSDVNTSILSSLRLICWVISWVLLFWYDVCCCYVVVWLAWCGFRMQTEAQLLYYFII